MSAPGWTKPADPNGWPNIRIAHPKEEADLILAPEFQPHRYQIGADHVHAEQNIRRKLAHHHNIRRTDSNYRLGIFGFLRRRC